MSIQVQGELYVACRPLRVGRKRVDGQEQTILIVNDRQSGTGFYVLLPDPSPEDEARPAFPIQRRCDLENAMLSLEYIAGGGKL